MGRLFSSILKNGALLHAHVSIWKRGYWETEWYASKTQEAATMFVKTYNQTQELNAVDGLHILCSIRPHHHWDLAGRTMMTATVATKHFYQLITEAAAAANCPSAIPILPYDQPPPIFQKLYY